MADLISMMSAAAGLGGGEYEISRSLRFNSADSAYLNRTPASAGNRKTWTWSAWIKRSGLGVNEEIFNARESTPVHRHYFDGDNPDKFRIFIRNSSNTVIGNYLTSAVFRDVSAWYHFVIAFDTTQATAANRVILYVNGVSQALTASTTISQNADGSINAAIPHAIGSLAIPEQYFNGYLTEIHFIDGQALTPTSFGEFNSDTGVWQPIEYTGTYGTNGFYLPFSDNASTTTLGDDFSGNGNDWTTNNFSVTAGAGNDSLVDSPTRYGTDTGAGGEVRGNYATLNPLINTAGYVSYANGNLYASVGPQDKIIFGTFAIPPSGKWYWEHTVNLVGAATSIGLSDTSVSQASGASFSGAVVRQYAQNGTKYDGASNTSYGASFTTNDIIGIAVDMDAGTIVFYKNGASQGTAFSDLVSSGKTWFPGAYINDANCFVNFGQRPFAYTAPSGFKALVTTNLPAPTIEDGGEYFNTVLYTGTGSSLGVTGVGFQPDWVWIKERSGAADHGLYDVLRGVQNQLESNTTTAETAEANGLTAFGTDGFTVGSLAQLNTSADTYVAWNWKANGAGVSNTDGTITSTVSANTDSGFSIVTYTGNGSAGATIGHGLGVVPAMTIIKRRSNTETWIVWHTAFNSAQSNVRLQSTDAVDTNSPAMFNNTFPTSTLITLGNGNFVNTSAETYVCYAFAPVAGYSAFGSYTGNGSADGPFVYTGFRPKFIMRKQTTDNGDVGGWVMFDTSRDLFNVATKRLLAQSSNAEVTPGNDIDILSNGWKERSSDGYTNASGQTFIYMAFAENPFSIALAR
jgi:hypothetical protein